MSTSKYILVALPTNIARSGDEDEAFSTLGTKVPVDAGVIYSLPIPALKIGTLDALVRQADELGKLDQQVEGAVAKVAEVLKNICEEGRIDTHKTVNDKPVDEYLKSFVWNKIKYRSEKSIGELMESLHKEVVSLDNDLKQKFSQYQQIKANLIALERKQIGNLATKSLAGIVNKDDFVQGSDYLETVLVAVPNSLKKEWLKSYEHLVIMVVPRSSFELSRDDEYTLYNVTVFRKYVPELIAKARAMKFVPRDFKWEEGGAEHERKETEATREQEKKLCMETLRLARTAWSDEFQAWIHIKALRVFVESVLRYGLPLEFVSAIIECREPKKAGRVKSHLDSTYGYLGGSAFGRDKKGRIKKEEHLGDYMTGDVADYTPYVYYEFEIA